tara:strand:- start:814 stop:1134 length:321 start_codon:yes stop_codon:yes gene_type:complete
MSFKTIAMMVNKEDVRKLVANSLTHILTRHSKNNKECLEKLNIVIPSGSNAEILESIRKILKTYNSVIEEINNIAPLVLEIEGLIAPDTEVVEDLPDLLEDSNGVD